MLSLPKLTETLNGAGFDFEKPRYFSLFGVAFGIAPGSSAVVSVNRKRCRVSACSFLTGAGCARFPKTNSHFRRSGNFEKFRQFKL